MTEHTEKSRKKSATIATLAGCFAAFTVCYAIFSFTCDYLGIEFDKSSVLYRASFIAAYLLVNVISWPIIKKYNN